MAVKTLYILDGTTNPAATPNWFGNMQEGGTAPTQINSSYGWGVAKTTSPSYWPARCGATGTTASASSGTTSFIDSKTSPTKGTGSGGGTSSNAGDSFIAGPYTGTFAATSWQFDWMMRAGTAGGVGFLRMRVWKSSNADGTSATELTSGALQGNGGVGQTLSTSADVNSSMTWSPGSITLSNEYLFFQIEWRETVTGSSASDNVLFRIGTAKITTPDFSTGGTVIFTPYRTKHRIRR